MLETSEKHIRASVIIVSYNQRTMLDACLRSLLLCTNSNDEIILVDNASSDGSAQHIEATFSNVHVIQSSKNLGFASGSNLGASNALGNYLVFLNPDTEVSPGWLEELITPLENDTGIGLATSKILLLNNPHRINTAGNNIHLSGLTMCRGLGLKAEALTKSTEVNAVSGAGFIIRRDLFERLHGFDPDFFMYMEDADLSWRSRIAGYKCLYIPSSVMYHDYALRFGSKKTYYQERNRYLMLLKSLRWPTFLILMPMLLLMEVISWGFVLFREPNRYHNKLDAYKWIVTNWGSIQGKRFQVQLLRRVSDRELLLKNSWRISFDQVDEGFVGSTARVIFNPLFYVFYRLIYLLIWW
jgi:GT2 family glycosyltransferase